jgi:hypothetical protein
VNIQSSVTPDFRSSTIRGENVPSSQERREEVQYDLKLMGAMEDLVLARDGNHYRSSTGQLLRRELKEVLDAERDLMEGLSALDLQGYLHQRLSLAYVFSEKIC